MCGTVRSFEIRSRHKHRSLGAIFWDGHRASDLRLFFADFLRGLLPGRLFSVDDFSSAFHRGLLDFSSVDFSSLDFLKNVLSRHFEEIKTAPNTMLTQGGGDVGLESFVIFIQFCAWDSA